MGRRIVVVSACTWTILASIALLIMGVTRASHVAERFQLSDSRLEHVATFMSVPAQYNPDNERSFETVVALPGVPNHDAVCGGHLYLDLGVCIQLSAARPARAEHLAIHLAGPSTAPPGDAEAWNATWLVPLADDVQRSLPNCSDLVLYVLHVRVPLDEQNNMTLEAIDAATNHSYWLQVEGVVAERYDAESGTRNQFRWFLSRDTRANASAFVRDTSDTYAQRWTQWTPLHEYVDAFYDTLDVGHIVPALEASVDGCTDRAGLGNVSPISTALLITVMLAAAALCTLLVIVIIIIARRYRAAQRAANNKLTLIEAVESGYLDRTNGGFVPLDQQQEQHQQQQDLVVTDPPLTPRAITPRDRSESASTATLRSVLESRPKPAPGVWILSDDHFKTVPLTRGNNNNNPDATSHSQSSIVMEEDDDDDDHIIMTDTNGGVDDDVDNASETHSSDGASSADDD